MMLPEEPLNEFPLSSKSLKESENPGLFIKQLGRHSLFHAIEAAPLFGTIVEFVIISLPAMLVAAV
ncbi:hypothetical protein P3436_25385, partial [Vibrio parahaemolyticus]|nr:hypothetical protein [Vibrio parahaemolyticus]